MIFSTISGVLLFLSDHPVHLIGLQGVALLPWLWALAKADCSKGQAVLAGATLGMATYIPTALYLQFPPLMAAGLTTYMVLVWLLMGLGMGLVLRWPGVWATLGAGAVAAVVEWLDCTVLPIWGTAQVFTRPWADLPQAAQLVRLGGVTTLVFVLVTAQAAVVLLWLRPKNRKQNALLLAILLIGSVAYSLVSWNRTPRSTIKVAAVGWTRAQLVERHAGTAADVLNRMIFPAVEQAVAQGARLVVSPETGLRLAVGDKVPLLRQLAARAAALKVALAVGYFDTGNNDNRIIFISKSGKLLGEYTKTHLIPFIEDYVAGEGKLALFELEGVAAGGMICQDDNFTDLARSYGRRGVQLMIVPTNDWRQVKDHHFDNSRFRPLEHGYGVVRAASNGISAIVSGRGEVLARRDHFVDGPGLIVADLPIYDAGGLHARFGHWPAFVGLLWLGIGWWVNRRKPK